MKFRNKYIKKNNNRNLMRWSLGKAKVMFRGEFIAWEVFLNIESENNELTMLLRIEGEANQSAKAEEEINKCRRIR